MTIDWVRWGQVTGRSSHSETRGVRANTTRFAIEERTFGSRWTGVRLVRVGNKRRFSARIRGECCMTCGMHEWANAANGCDNLTPRLTLGVRLVRRANVTTEG